MSILKRQGELTEVDGILLPKYGALKVGEVQIYQEFVQKWPELRKGLTDAQADVEAALHSVTILLRRLNPEWTVEDTKASEWTLPFDGKVGGKTETFEPDAIFTEELYKFFQGERDRWPKENVEPVEEAEEKPGKKPTGKASTGSLAKRTKKSSAASKSS